MEFFRRLSHPLAFEYTILLNSMTEMKEVAEMRRHLENRNRQGNSSLHEELEELFNDRTYARVILTAGERSCWIKNSERSPRLI